MSKAKGKSQWLWLSSPSIDLTKKYTVQFSDYLPKSSRNRSGGLSGSDIPTSKQRKRPNLVSFFPWHHTFGTIGYLFTLWSIALWVMKAQGFE